MPPRHLTDIFDAIHLFDMPYWNATPFDMPLITTNTNFQNVSIFSHAIHLFELPSRHAPPFGYARRLIDTIRRDIISLAREGRKPMACGVGREGSGRAEGGRGEEGQW